MGTVNNTNNMYVDVMSSDNKQVSNVFKCLDDPPPLNDHLISLPLLNSHLMQSSTAQLSLDAVFHC